MDFEIEGIVQTGSVRASSAADAARQDVSAWFLDTEAGYLRSDAWKTHVSLEFDHASGDAPGGDVQRFDTLYGMRRADLAPSGIFGMVGRANISALGLRVEVAPSARVDAFANWLLRGRMLREAPNASPWGDPHYGAAALTWTF